MKTYLLERARRAMELAERCSDPADKAAYRAAAGAWEKLAGEGSPWSHKPAQQSLAALKARAAEPLPAASADWIQQKNPGTPRVMAEAISRASTLAEASIDF